MHISAFEIHYVISVKQTCLLGVKRDMFNLTCLTVLESVYGALFT